ncbi:hypothetical protein Tco_1477808, partial [Tanacetum coccineum]
MVPTGTSLSVLRTYPTSVGPDDSGPGPSFDRPVSSEYMPGLGRASLVQDNWQHYSLRRCCMKDWKTGFFLTDRRAIPDYMHWRHPDSVITDPEPSAGCYDQSEVRRLSAFVVKLHDMPEGVLVLSGLIRDWKSRTRDLILRDSIGNGTKVQEELHHNKRLTLQRLPFYFTHHAAANAAIPDPTLEDLAATTPNTKVLAKAKASKKRKASSSGDGEESDDDPYACVEIPLITPIRFAATIPLE